MRRGLLLTLVSLAAFGAALFGYKYQKDAKRAAAVHAETASIETVAAIAIQPVAWLPTLRIAASVVATQQVRLAAPLAGTVRRIAFTSGSSVKTGQLLVQLDDIENRAQLSTAQAEAELARVRLKRSQELLALNFIARSRMEEAEASAKRAEADLQIAAAVLEKKSIRAPFAGYVSLRDINLGQYLAEGAALVELQSLDPVFIDFSVPQDSAADLAIGRDIVVEVGGGEPGRRRARISAINPAADSATRSIRARATLANADHLLRPGSFVQVELPLGRPASVLAVPGSALRRNAFATSVFVVVPGPRSKSATGLVAQERVVQLGAPFGDQVIIASGLKSGETVVVAGAFKLRNGAAVRIDNRVLPPGVRTGAAPSPDPEQSPAGRP